MKAIELTALRLDAFRAATVATPEPQRGEVLIRLRAASLNFVDVAVASGNYPGPSFPLIPVVDGAGEIVGIGEGVSRLAVNDRVIAHAKPHWIGGRPRPYETTEMRGVTLPGSLAEYVALPANAVVPVPAHLSELNWLETVGDFEGGQRVPTLQINDILSIKRAVQGGAGIAMLPDYVVSKDSGLVQLLPETEVPSFDTYFAYPDAMKNQAKLHVFRDFIIAKARSWSF
ncbi:hypothetical protein EOC93_12320 [Mesorhizobium sp. M6A.T.Ce.TU.002.03.1.1]|nr:LysR substrate-binding domain-containing protein [Mesorhizobium sp. M6A.T.Ce.TU.002.03.1.1]RUU44162.1 hypothetical protein EOC93_12320 [Mesorhizobium sp. M6A.T.Ce.TU.002.03.1.1]